MAGPRNATTTGKGRTYKWRDETFTSVTTILSGGVPKPALTSWAARATAEWAVKNIDQVTGIAKSDPAAAIDMLRGAPWRDRDAAAVKGTDIHAAVEAHVLGQPVPEWSREVAPSMRQFETFVEQYGPTFEMSEASVYNRAHGYAGTLDAIVVIDGVRYLLDVKTGKGVYGEVALQLAAYRHAEFIGLDTGDEVPMPAVDACAVLHLRPRTFSLIPVEAGEAEFRFFLYAQQVRDFATEHSRLVLGAPLAPAGQTAEVA